MTYLTEIIVRPLMIHIHFAHLTRGLYPLSALLLMLLQGFELDESVSDYLC